MTNGGKGGQDIHPSPRTEAVLSFWFVGGSKVHSFVLQNTFLSNNKYLACSGLSALPKYGHWEVENLLKWIRKSGNVTGNPVNWMRKSYCAVFRGADGLMIKCFWGGFGKHSAFKIIWNAKDCKAERFGQWRACAFIST